MSSEENRKNKPAEPKRPAGHEQVKSQAAVSPAQSPASAAQRASAAEASVAQAAAGQASATQAPPAQPDLTQELAKCRQDIASLQDQLLRKAAEFENFRKRMFREREEGVRYANALLLGDIIPIIDDFERALQSASESKDFTSFHSGVEMIERQLVSVLERNWGLKRFTPQSGPEGERFDPEKHEAIAVEELPSSGDPVVLENYQKGYYLHDRVLRPAKVKVSRPKQNVTNGNKE
jgi:molecular chaperone GrpE